MMMTMMMMGLHANVAIQLLKSMRRSSSSSSIGRTNANEAALLMLDCLTVASTSTRMHLVVRRLLPPLPLECDRLCPSFIRFRSRLLSLSRTLNFELSGGYVAPLSCIIHSLSTSRCFQRCPIHAVQCSACSPALVPVEQLM